MVKVRYGNRPGEVEKTDSTQRIGLFGGTFDPVHKAHLSIARQAAEEARLDEVLFLPAADPPHKKAPGAAYQHRVAMLESVLGASPTTAEDRFAVSLLEAELPFPSYTVETLYELKRRLPNSRCYFIIGADSLLDLHRWCQYQELLTLTRFIVISRPGIVHRIMQQALERLPGSFQPDSSGRRWFRSDGSEFLLLNNRLKKDISSTMIRAELRQGGQPREVDRRVREYIQRERLYRGYRGVS